MQITITIPGDPIPKIRHRVRKGRHGMYDPQQKQKEQVAMQILFQIKNFVDDMILDPVELDVLFYMPIPKNTPKYKKEKMLTGEIRHTKKPDCDNLLKFYKDCMNKIVYLDDAQVYRVLMEKVYDENPRTHIIIKSKISGIRSKSQRLHGTT